jgi:hypothetical protein
MFESTILRSSKDNSPISVGQIAEALLYYQRVHIFIDRGTLFNLIKQLGIDRFLVLLEHPEISAVYCEEMLCVSSDPEKRSPFYSLLTAFFAGTQSHGKLRKLQDRLELELKQKGYQESEAMRFSRIFTKKVPKRKFSGDYFLKGGIVNAARSDLLDDVFIRKAVRSIITNETGSDTLCDNLKFEVTDSINGQLFVDTNIDLSLINQRRLRLRSSAEPLTIAHLLSKILNARADLALASFYGGDFVTSEISSSIIQVRHAELLRRTYLNAEMRQEFTNIVLPDSPSISEVIDSGERTFDEFLKLLDEAKKFKKWINGVNPDEGLIRSYQQDVSSPGWIQKLPAKVLRYVFTSQIGDFTENPFAEKIAGLADSFIIDKLFKGWRPNHFIDSKLSRFIE